jgi:hypothetical protein
MVEACRQLNKLSSSDAGIEMTLEANAKKITLAGRCLRSRGGRSEVRAILSFWLR